MLDLFIQAYCNGKFEPVYKLMGEDRLPKEQRWKVILEEFSWLMKNEDGDHLYDLQFKILALSMDIDFVKYACYYADEKNKINMPHDPEVIERLCNIYPFDYTDSKNITLALTMCGTKEYEREILQDEYERVKPKEKDNGNVQMMTEEVFDKEIAALSKHQGYRIDKKTTSVREYAAAYQNLLTEIKHKRKESG